jgi:hypothetical protein
MRLASSQLPRPSMQAPSDAGKWIKSTNLGLQARRCGSHLHLVTNTSTNTPDPSTDVAPTPESFTTFASAIAPGGDGGDDADEKQEEQEEQEEQQELEIVDPAVSTVQDNTGDKDAAATSPVNTKGKGKEKAVEGDTATPPANKKAIGKGKEKVVQGAAATSPVNKKGKGKEKAVRGDTATSPASKEKASESLYKPGFVESGVADPISRPTTETQGR